MWEMFPRPRILFGNTFLLLILSRYVFPALFARWVVFILIRPLLRLCFLPALCVFHLCIHGFGHEVFSWLCLLGWVLVFAHRRFFLYFLSYWVSVFHACNICVVAIFCSWFVACTSSCAIRFVVEPFVDVMLGFLPFFTPSFFFFGPCRFLRWGFSLVVLVVLAYGMLYVLA